MILKSECLPALRGVPAGTIDCVITDPPYFLINKSGQGFMGMEWDGTKSSDPYKEIYNFHRTWGAQALRVLKPGAFMCVMAPPRQDVLSRMMIAFDDAGFETSFTPIFWAYSTGFPKGTNVAKAIDKKMGCKPTPVAPKPYTNPDFKDPQFIEQGSMMQSSETAPRIQMYDTEPTHPDAKKLNGAYVGYQPKPAVEVIIICMKPITESTHIAQAQANGKGVSWIDDCRIPFRDKDDLGDPDRFKGANIKSINFEYMNNKDDAIVGQLGGRFPANLITSDGALDTGKVTKATARYVKRDVKQHTYGNGRGIPPMSGPSFIDDEGTVNRYFDLDMWESQFLVVAKPSQDEKNQGLRANKEPLAEFCKAEDAAGIFPYRTNDGRTTLPNVPHQRGVTLRLNSHPTVKPITLMSYLITMFTRPGDLILDPFVGSGTTHIAAQLLGRDAIGIERDHHSCVIAEARLAYWKNRSYEKVQQMVREQEMENQATLEAFT